MFTNGTKMVALFTIAIALSVIAPVGIVNSAFAETRKSTIQSYLSLPTTVGEQSENRGDDSGNDDGPPPAVLGKDRPSSLMSHSDDSSNDDDGPPPAVSRNNESYNIGDSDWTTADNNTIPERYMKSLSNCESSAAADGHLKLTEIMDCFYRVF
jgi:hypothetical protein